MHSETYPAFFTPRDKEPSHSSSEETSSEFVWLEIKIKKKQKYEGKTEQVLCKNMFLTMILLLSDYIWMIYISLLYIGSKIYIEKIFSKKYPNNIFD